MEETKKDELFYEEPQDGETLFHRYLKSAPQSFCLYPFTHLNFKASGDIGLCFRSAPIGDLRKESALEAWNNVKSRNLRRDLTSGEKSQHCQSCWKMEEGGSFSYRQETLRDITVHADWRDEMTQFDRPTGEMKPQVRSAELRFSKTCNLQCRMCGPLFSTKWEKEWVDQSPLKQWYDQNGYHKTVQEQLLKEDDLFLQSRILEFLKANREHLRYLMITGGEPFLDDSHYEALEILKPYGKDIVLEYTSNLNTLRHKQFEVLEYWKHFKQVILKVSLDGDPLLYEHIRHGGKLEAVENNIRKIYEIFPIQNNAIAKHFPSERVVIVLTCTTSAYNVARLPETALYFTRLGGLFHASQVQYPPMLSSRVLPPALKQSITERVQKFVENIPQALEAEWGQPIWKRPEVRALQERRVYRFLLNSLKYMNGADDSRLFPKLISFDQTFSGSKGVQGILDIYPEWKAYV